MTDTLIKYTGWQQKSRNGTQFEKPIKSANTILGQVAVS